MSKIKAKTTVTKLKGTKNAECESGSKREDEFIAESSPEVVFQERSYDDLSAKWDQAIHICRKKTWLIRTKQKANYKFTASMEGLLNKFIANSIDCWSLIIATLKQISPGEYPEEVARKRLGKPQYKELPEKSKEYKHDISKVLIAAFSAGIIPFLIIVLTLPGNFGVAFFFGLIVMVASFFLALC